MILKDVYEILDKIAPFKYQCEWDNSGLLLGSFNDDVKRILITLDVTDEVVEQAVQAKADLVISHHPLIFSPLMKINDDDFIAARVLKLARNNISLIAMHTNMDTTGLSDVANELLGLKKERAIEVDINENDEKIGIGSIGYFVNENNEAVNITLRDAIIRTKKEFGLSVVKVYGNPDNIIEKAAVCTGAGKSMIEECIKEKCDLLITGDITYHAALDAVQRGMSIIDAGHFETEIIFVDLLISFFKMNFEELEIIPTIQKNVGEYM